MLIFFYVYFSPYRRLRESVLGMRWQEAGKALARIRTFIGVNLSIGLLTVALAAAGKHLL